MYIYIKSDYKFSRKNLQVTRVLKKKKLSLNHYTLFMEITEYR